MKLAAVLALLVILPSTLHAEPTLVLTPSASAELSEARRQQILGRNLVIAGAALQLAGGLMIAVAAATTQPNSGRAGSDAFLGVDGAAAIMGFTSLFLFPAGITYWIRGARHENLALIGTTIAPDRARKYERVGTALLYSAAVLGVASTVLAVLDSYGDRFGVQESLIATFTSGAVLTAVGAPLAIAGHRHAHVQLGLGGLRGTF